MQYEGADYWNAAPWYIILGAFVSPLTIAATLVAHALAKSERGSKRLNIAGAVLIYSVAWAGLLLLTLSR